VQVAIPLNVHNQQLIILLHRGPLIAFSSNLVRRQWHWFDREHKGDDTYHKAQQGNIANGDGASQPVYEWKLCVDTASDERLCCNNGLNDGVENGRDRTAKKKCYVATQARWPRSEAPSNARAHKPQSAGNRKEHQKKPGWPLTQKKAKDSWLEVLLHVRVVV